MPFHFHYFIHYWLFSLDFDTHYCIAILFRFSCHASFHYFSFDTLDYWLLTFHYFSSLAFLRYYRHCFIFRFLSPYSSWDYFFFLLLISFSFITSAWLFRAATLFACFATLAMPLMPPDITPMPLFSYFQITFDFHTYILRQLLHAFLFHWSPLITPFHAFTLCHATLRWCHYFFHASCHWLITLDILIRLCRQTLFSLPAPYYADIDFRFIIDSHYAIISLSFIIFIISFRYWHFHYATSLIFRHWLFSFSSLRYFAMPPLMLRFRLITPALSSIFRSAFAFRWHFAEFQIFFDISFITEIAIISSPGFLRSFGTPSAEPQLHGRRFIMLSAMIASQPPPPATLSASVRVFSLYDTASAVSLHFLLSAWPAFFTMSHRLSLPGQVAACVYWPVYFHGYLDIHELHCHSWHWDIVYEDCTYTEIAATDGAFIIESFHIIILLSQDTEDISTLSTATSFIAEAFSSRIPSFIDFLFSLITTT